MEEEFGESWTVQGISVASVDQAEALACATPEQIHSIIETYNEVEETTMPEAVEAVLGVSPS